MTAKATKPQRSPPTYVLDKQVGFMLRQVNQRHTTLFASGMPSDVTPTQWAALTKLAEVGPTSQNHLGRMTAMDVATIKGVVDRLTKRGFVRTRADARDARRRLVMLTTEGTEFVTTHVAAALTVTEQTLAPLEERERTLLLWLLTKMM